METGAYEVTFIKDKGINLINTKCAVNIGDYLVFLTNSLEIDGNLKPHLFFVNY
jgi:hypothetical protein